MELSQQNDALKYFRRYAKEWCKRSLSYDSYEVNIIQQRNKYVLDVISSRSTTKSTLDVGCGTGHLVLEIAKRGINAIGIDFAEEMIKYANKQKSEYGVDAATFECRSIFECDFGVDVFDAISANGFIEYISLEQLNEFLDFVFKSLRSEGSLILSSRNRLFNVFSLNEFTEFEIKENTALILLKEALMLVMSPNYESLLEEEVVPLRYTHENQPNTGIDVSIRYQYTPVQLLKLMNNKGFTVRHFHPIHIHGVVPSFKEKEPQVHAVISNLLQEYSDKCGILIPFSTSFMIHAVKQ